MKSFPFCSKSQNQTVFREYLFCNQYGEMLSSQGDNSASHQEKGQK